jgi:outer membrane protein OmpU
MRKVLLAATALTSMGILAGAAQAAEPIKLEVGGIMNQWAGAIFQEGDKYVATYNHFGIVSQSQVHFKGATTLDNGIKVSAVIELEAERTNTSGATTANTPNRTNDRNAAQQYVFFTTNFGELSIGERSDVQMRVHNAAPRVGPGADVLRQFIVARAGHLAAPATNAAYDATDFSAVSPPSEKIDYISPSFAGLSLAVGYTPSVYTNGFGRGPANKNTHTNDMIDGALVYNREIGTAKIGLDAGYMTLQYPKGSGGTAATAGGAQGMSYGFKGSYAGFTLGGSYLRIIDAYHDNGNTGTGSMGGWAWDAGLAYETGPYSFGFTYYKESQKETINTKGNDTSTYYQLGSKYNMGPGIDFLGSVNYVNHKDELNTDASNTSGWAVITGLNLAF